MRSAKTRIAWASGVANRPFPVAPNVAGDQILLGVPLTTEPGDYSVVVSFVNEAGEERNATIQVKVEPFATAAAGSSIPPVVLLDGWQQPVAGTCPMSNDSTTTFGKLSSYLSGSPNFAPTVYFFENCNECPNCTIEQLGTNLGTFLNSIYYTDGTSVPQIDVVAHSMGGLIVRSYLSGKQQTSGAFRPPGTQKIRKAVFVGTPHFGSFQADTLLADIVFGLGNQTNEMKRGSQFVWDLATWNQFGDDLRGVDALAVIGNGGSYNGISQASDGVVALSSGALDFARPGRTRIVNYCHIPLTPGLEANYLGCEGPGIADIETPSHPTYQIVSSFLIDSSTWQGVGSSPAQDQYLSKYGGIVVADVNPAGQFVGGLSGVSWGSVQLSNGSASGELSYNDFVNGTASFALGGSTCGPYTAIAGVYSAVRCKFGPSVYSIGPLLPVSDRIVQAGTTITISGAGFGVQQPGQVTAYNPQSTALQVSSWNDTTITAFLPASFGIGIAQIGVTTSGGYDSINIMAGTVLVPPVVPPVISLSASSLSFAFTVGGTTPPAQSVSVANSGGGSLTHSVASNAAWLIASAQGGTISVSVSPAGLTANTYQGAITVASLAASNSLQTISVKLVVGGASAGGGSGPTIAAVVNGASFKPGIAANTFVSIEGSGLSATSRGWATGDFNGTQLPTSLDGVSVTINNKPAFVQYISPTLVNVISPVDTSVGPVAVILTNNGVASNTMTAQKATYAPSFFLYNSDKYIVALHANYTLIGPTSLYPGASTPAKAGETIILFGNGFGPTTPAIQNGQIVNGAPKLANPVTFQIGGVSGIVPTFAGLTYAGEYQIDVTIPTTTPSGDIPLTATMGGVPSSQPALITVQ